jgi:hypothetical protein
VSTLIASTQRIPHSSAPARGSRERHSVENKAASWGELTCNPQFAPQKRRVFAAQKGLR